MRENTGQKIN